MKRVECLRALAAHIAAPALRSLRLRLALLLFAAIAFVSLLVTWSSSRELASAYSEAGKSEALAIARSFADDFSKADLDRPEQLEQRLRTLRQLNPNVHKASIYTLARGRAVRAASTDPEEVGGAVEAHDVAPIGPRSSTTRRNASEASTLRK